MKRITAINYSIELVRPDAGEGALKIVFFSDLHKCCVGEEGKRLLELIRLASPDIILCGGDSLVADSRPVHESLLDFMRRLPEIAPVYAADGNHEMRVRYREAVYPSLYRNYVDSLKSMGITHLRDAHAVTRVNGVRLSIFGYDMAPEFYGRMRRVEFPGGELKRVLGEPDGSSVCILMGHHPKIIEKAFGWGADITLCGHFHGGIMRLSEHRGLVSPELFPFPANAYGHFQKGGKHGIITSGCGEHGIPLRINNPREIVVLDIQVSDNGNSR